MREPANKSLLTDVSGFCFHPCTIIPRSYSPKCLEKTLRHAPTLDMGHKRMREAVGRIFRAVGALSARHAKSAERVFQSRLLDPGIHVLLIRRQERRG